ncbi:transcriptional regulator with XRE-family HTH domain [Virgibacillus natechei]|uniref:Transcriptional regulator with XRE-family HTH domain n=1 Tax=Virgibacillus natechei TaxID=1216297 RepID=A0ABS4IDM6_9BACI|nr:transcriptional regulator with XRE-family HTH domain [Virgibacillus natechei]
MSPVYAKVIFARRMGYGYSQQELAKKANIGLKTISRAEGGFDTFRSKRMIRFSMH